MAIIAAHQSATKATPAHHHAQGAAAHDAAPGGEAALFAQLLAQTGDASQTDAKDAKSYPEKTFDPHGGKFKKTKDDADDATGNPAEMGALPAHLAALNAKFASANGQTPKAKQDKTADDADPVKAADAAKDAGREAGPILNRIMDAKAADAADKTTPAKDGGKESPAKDDIAATVKSDETAEAAAAMPAAHVAASSKAAHSAAAKNAGTRPVSAADIAGVTDATKATDAAKTDAAQDKDAKTAKADDTKADAAKDPQTSVADKGVVLAQAIDKNTRQSAASQGTQARALPVHLQAQGATDKDSDGGKAGSDAKGSAPAQHARNDTDAKTQENAVQPTGQQAPLNTAGATQSASHTQAQAQTANVQPVTAQTQTQTLPTVAASLQVAPQTASQAAAQAQLPPGVAALAVQIAAKSSEGSKQFDIRLDPPELGRVDVKLSIDDMGRAQAHLAVEKPQTLDLLQHDRSSLEQALKNSGIDLSQNGLNFSLKGQDRQGDNSTPFRGRSRNLAVTAAIESTSAAVAASTHSFAAGNTRLDIRV